MGSTTLNGAVAVSSLTVVLTAYSGLSEDDPIGIALDNGAVHWSFIDEITLGTVTLGSPMPGAAASGNAVYLPSLDNETWA